MVWATKGSRGLWRSVCLSSPVCLLVCIPHNKGRRQGVSLGADGGGDWCSIVWIPQGWCSIIREEWGCVGAGETPACLKTSGSPGGTCLLGTWSRAEFKLPPAPTTDVTKTAMARIPRELNDVLTSDLPPRGLTGVAEMDSLWVTTSSAICHHFLSVIRR